MMHMYLKDMCEFQICNLIWNYNIFIVFMMLLMVTQKYS